MIGRGLVRGLVDVGSGGRHECWITNIVVTDGGAEIWFFLEELGPEVAIVGG